LLKTISTKRKAQNPPTDFALFIFLFTNHFCNDIMPFSLTEIQTVFMMIIF